MDWGEIEGARRCPVGRDRLQPRGEIQGLGEAAAVHVGDVVPREGRHFRIRVAHGDGANDVEVMGIVGHPVAMGNADPEVSVLARHHVSHVDRGGLAEALDLAARL